MTELNWVGEDLAFFEVLQRHRARLEKVVRGIGVDDAINLLVSFRSRVCLENQVQNLTRILAPEEFYLGHVVDALALHESGFLGSRNFDLGSGAGVPGLPSACLDRGVLWVLNDSERKKADFIDRTARELGLKHVTAQAGRAEDILPNQPDIRVISRAVGPVLRIFNWIEKCSTWNTLVLLKGPSWPDEWSEFQKSGKRNKLSIAGQFEYSIEGPESKQRRLVLLRRN